ncbi:hypothetical protein QJS10_CPA02g00954 [Acorus calamus]|uniref:Protein LITTLE ZIPPER 3 n=1 Tax=Acorus calamus TaxID=4465 RepID=A0AAV9FDQ7_ACOCL|nr:hypothetical protein QJS10_CPA02g00954 [Acorus calamus]
MGYDGPRTEAIIANLCKPTRPTIMLNSKLYLQNCYILQENERLRRKAQLLNQENQALLSELKQKLAKANKKANKPSNNLIPDLNCTPSSNANHPNSTRP